MCIRDSFNPSLIVLFDQAESPLYDIELELKEECGFTDYKVEIGDVPVSYTHLYSVPRHLANEDLKHLVS